LTAVPLIFSSVLTAIIITYENQITLFNWQDWFLITLVCCLTCTCAFTPPTLLALIFGYFIGWHAVLPVFAMNMVAIFLVNIITKLIDREEFKSYLSDNKKVSAILENIRREELKIIFFTKLSPVLPFALTNFVFALSGAKLKNILLGGFLGMIPRTALAIWTGSQAKEIRRLLANPNEGNLQKILIIVLIILSVGGILYLVLPKKNTP
jgi:uncharacterized membrane protein YdjX (TVP38/TMEM64 family)